MTIQKFKAGLMFINSKGEKKPVRDQAHLERLNDDGLEIVDAVPAAQNSGVKPVTVKDEKNLTPQERKAIRSANLRESLVIPEVLEPGEYTAKVITFHKKKSTRSGNAYSACMLNVDGVEFSTLDNDDTAELLAGDVVDIEIKTWVEGMTDKNGREIPKPNSKKVLFFV